MPKEKPTLKDSELKDLPQVRRFNSENANIQSGLNEIIKMNLEKGLTLDQMMTIVRTSNRKIGQSFRSVVKASRQMSADQLNDVPRFSSAEVKARDKLSMEALEQYAKSQYIRQYKDMALNNLVADGKVSDKEKQDLKTSRDIMQLLLKSGLDEKTEKENIGLINYMLGRNLDQNSMSPEEFEDRKAKQYAEIFNAKMTELVNFDYSRFHNMNDRELVENWEEYSSTLTDIFIIRNEISSACSQNKYINRELGNKCIEIEKQEAEPYALDCFRFRAMSTPHYASNPVYFFDNVHGNAVDGVDDYISEELDDDLQLKRFTNEQTSIKSNESAYMVHKICDDLNRRAFGVTRHNVQIFDTKGKKLTDSDDIMYALRTGGILAAPQDRPDLVTAYKFNTETRNADVKELTPYFGVVENITRDMRDLAAEWEAEDRMLAGSGIEKFFEKSSAVTESGPLFKDIVARAGNKDAMKAAMISKLQRTIAPYHPATEGDAFAEIVGLTKVETLSKKTVEERRQITSGAVEKYVEYALGSHEFFQAEDSLMAANDPAVTKDMFMHRIGEYEAFCNDFYGKNISDANIVDNLGKFLELKSVIGGDFKEKVVDKCVGWGVQFTPDEMKRIQELSEKAAVLGNYAESRTNYILTAHYQYGSLNKLGDFETHMGILSDSGDIELQRSANAAIESKIAFMTTLGRQIIAAADPENKLAADVIYDSKGNVIPGNDFMKLGEAAAGSDRFMMFFKGEPNPVVIDVKDAGKVPPELAQAEMTPQLASEIRAVKLNKSLADIEKNGLLSPEMKTLEQSIAVKEYELSAIAESLKVNDAGSDTLKTTMADYLARLTVREMQKKLAAQGDRSNTAVPEQAIKGFAEALANDPITDKVMDDIRKAPNGFSSLKGEDVYRDLLKHKQAANKAEEEKRLAEQAEKHAKAVESAKVISKNVKYFRDLPPGNDNALFGLTEQIKTAVDNQSKINRFNVTRAAIQAVSISFMIEEGKDIKKVFDPELQPDRERTAKEAMKLFISGDVEKIAGLLGKTMEKLHGELCSTLDRMEDYNVADVVRPENENLLKMSAIFKDFTQEFDTAYANIEGDKTPYKKYTAIQEAIHAPCKIINAVGITYLKYAKHEDQIANGQAIDQVTNDMIQGYMRFKLHGMMLKQWKAEPANAGKPVSDFFNMEGTWKSEYINLAINDCPELKKLQKMCTKDKILKNKVIASILDDTFDKEMDLKLIPQDDGSFKTTMDLNQGVKNLGDRLNLNLRETVHMFENVPQRQEAPKAKVQQVLA